MESVPYMYIFARNTRGNFLLPLAKHVDRFATAFKKGGLLFWFIFIFHERDLNWWVIFLQNSEAVKAKSQFFFFQDSEIIYSNQKTLNEICMKILRRIIKALIQEKDNMYENYEALNTCDSIF